MHSMQLQSGTNFGSIGKLVRNKRIHQRGSNLNYSIPYHNLNPYRSYSIRRAQRGGFGGAFLGLARFLIPLIRSGYKALKSEALDAGADILRNLKDQGIENIVKKRSKEAVQNLKTKAVNKLDSLMSGEGKSRKKPRKTIKRMKLKKKAHINPGVARLRLKKRKKRSKSIKKKSFRRKTRTKRVTIKDIFG